MFDECIAYIHKNKGFEPEDLKKAPVRKLSKNIASILTQAVNAGLNNNSIKHETPPELRQALEDNVQFFTGMKVFHELTDAALSLIDAKGNMKSYNEFKHDVQAIHASYNERYLNTEYIFATQSALMAAKWHDFEEDGDSYNLQYRTAGDEKVREDHAILHNITLPIDDPFWDNYTPPLGWRCRCTVVQVRKSKHKTSNSTEAAAKGAAATTFTNKKGVNTLEMFRFNPGKEQIAFPKKHPYMPRENSPAHVKQAGEVVKSMIETWETIETTNGKIRISSLHGKKEKAENIEIAKYFAEKYGHTIDLIKPNQNKKTADAYNYTKKEFQEYKTNKTPTKSAIDSALRGGGKQAKHIVINIISDISEDVLTRGIIGRVNKKNEIEKVTIIRNNEDKTYTREQISQKGFTL